MRTMGLDLGTKTIGVAVSDGLGLTAQGVTTVRRASLKADLAARFRDDRAAYSKHKTAFVDAIVLGMGGPARKTPWNP